MQLSIPIEIYQNILLLTDFITQIRMRQINKIFYEKLEIHDFFNIPDKYLFMLSDNILINYPFIKQLYAYANKDIKIINYMKKLVKLNAGDNCGINNEEIAKINVIELNVYNNPKITNVNHMTRLQILYAGSNCGINDAGIKYINLHKLHAGNNPNITNVNHMTKLEDLTAYGYCGVNDAGIQDLNLKQLYIFGNQKISLRIN